MPAVDNGQNETPSTTGPQDYVDAARDAIAAGFDGVEIHGASGYVKVQRPMPAELAAPPPQEPADAESTDPVQLEVRFHSVGSAEQLLLFGPAVEVLEPAELRDALVRRAQGSGLRAQGSGDHRPVRRRPSRLTALTARMRRYVSTSTLPLTRLRPCAPDQDPPR